MSAKTIEFKASIAPTASALQAHGDTGGFRLILDFPESEQDAYFQLVTMRNQVLNVVIEPE